METPAERSKQLFGEVIDLLSEYYYEDLDLEDWTRRTLRHGLNELDKHASLNKKSIAEETTKNRLRFGFHFALDEHGMRIIKIEPRSPAWTAGFTLGDRIIKIGGQSIFGLGLREISNLIDKNEPLELTVLRNGALEELILRKSKIDDLPPYEGIMLAGSVGYIYLERFQIDVAQSLCDILKPLRNAEAYILDLRTNFGGYLQAALQTIGYFTPPDTLLITLLPRAGNGISYSSTRQCVNITTKPLVILVNHETASAGELVTQVLQESGRALVIGETTMGLGTTATSNYIFGGEYDITIPHFKYFGPTGHAINKIGVIPDLQVKDKNPAGRYIRGIRDPILEEGLRYLRKEEPYFARK